MIPKSKIVHGIHLLGVLAALFSWLFLTTFTEFLLFSVVFANLLHPSHHCFLTHLENKYREQEGLPRIKWLKHYIKSGKLFRKD